MEFGVATIGCPECKRRLIVLDLGEIAGGVVNVLRRVTGESTRGYHFATDRIVGWLREVTPGVGDDRDLGLTTRGVVKIAAGIASAGAGCAGASCLRQFVNAVGRRIVGPGTGHVGFGARGDAPERVIADGGRGGIGALLGIDLLYQPSKRIVD